MAELSGDYSITPALTAQLEIWPQVLEQALRELRHGDMVTSPTLSWEILTGATSQIVLMNTLTSDEAFELIRKSIYDDSKEVVVGTDNVTVPKGISANHAYSVQWAFTEDGVKKLRLYNPHGVYLERTMEEVYNFGEEIYILGPLV